MVYNILRSIDLDSWVALKKINLRFSLGNNDVIQTVTILKRIQATDPIFTELAPNVYLGLT